MKKLFVVLLLLSALTVIGIACGSTTSSPVAPSGPVQASAGTPTPIGTLIDTPTETPVFGNSGEVTTLAGLAGVVGVTNGGSVTLAAHAPPTSVPSGTVTPSTAQVTTNSGPTVAMTPARFKNPSAVAVDSAGNVYVMDTGNDLIRRINSDGSVTVVAGQAGIMGITNGTVTEALFRTAYGIAVDDTGNIYVADSANNVIRKISTLGKVTTLAGSGVTGATNGTGIEATFNKPYGVAVDHSGNVYVADTGNHLIRKISKEGEVKTLAGSGTMGAVNAQGVSASFNFPTGIAVDHSGNVYVADRDNQLIRKVTSGGQVTTVAGQAGKPGAADGPVTMALFNKPTGIAVDSKGNLYVADKGNHLIRKISKDGVVSTLAGQAGAPGATDGTGPDASFKEPTGVAVNSWGSVIVADTGNLLIRKIQ